MGQKPLYEVLRDDVEICDLESALEAIKGTGRHIEEMLRHARARDCANSDKAILEDANPQVGEID